MNSSWIIMVRSLLVLGFVAGLGLAPLQAAEEETVPVEVLEMRIKHLTAEELTGEADHWVARLKDTVRRLNEAKEHLWYDNRRLEAAQEAVDATVSEGEGEERPPDPALVAEVEKEIAIKDRELARVEELREERLQVIDRLDAVLDELSAKLGTDEKGDELGVVLEYRLYVDAVKGVQVDVSDTRSAWSTVISWLRSPEGGVRWAKRIGQFLGIVVGAWLLSLLLGRLAGKAMSLAHGASQILRRFVVNSIRRITIAAGLLLGLAAMDINVTPLVAVIGAAGFVIAFALQNTLSNFASGLMIMFYKPFDIGDFVQTADVMGKVQSMTLVTTNLMTPDNKLQVVPNNELWGKVVTNVTGSSERRVDLVFGIGYGDDMSLAERVLREVVTAHPSVLDEPEPVVAVAELADSSVNLICRPWVKTPDYWAVYWDITRKVKEAFDAQGISIPFPQRDVHLYTEAGPGPVKHDEQGEKEPR